jgi:hypothetical protein
LKALCSGGLWMPDASLVDLFGEDQAHEAYVGALIRRLLRDAGRDARVRTRSALGGHGRMTTELDALQKAVRGGQSGLDVPDILVVARDANCERFSNARRTIQAHIDRTVFRASAIACPDPHIERWFLADPISFRQVVGAEASAGKRKCIRNLYKRRLADAIRNGGHPVTLGGIEFAIELVEALDLYRAGRNEPSLQHFIEDFRQALVLVTR